MPHNVIDRSLRMVGCTAVLRWCIFFVPFCRGWDSACVTFPEMKISCNRNRGAARVEHKRNKNQGFLIPATD